MDSLVSNPGLTHLAIDIFSGLDPESLYNAEKASSRASIVDNGVWRRKLMATVSKWFTNHVLALDKDKEETSVLCRSLCLNRAWFDMSNQAKYHQFSNMGHASSVRMLQEGKFALDRRR